MITRSRLFVPVLMFLNACAGAASSPFEEVSPAATQVEIHVENRGFNDIRLYAVSSRGPQSLGPITGASDRTVHLSWSQPDRIAFRIDVLAGHSYMTESIALSPGDRIELLIPDDPRNTIIKAR